MPFREARQIVLRENIGDLVVKYFTEIDLVIDEMKRIADR